MFEVKEGAFLLRTQPTGDKIYLVQDGERFWIKNPETLHKLGFSFGQEKEVKYQVLLEYKDGGPIDMKPRKLDISEPVVEEKKKPILNYRRSA